MSKLCCVLNSVITCEVCKAPECAKCLRQHTIYRQGENPPYAPHIHQEEKYVF